MSELDEIKAILRATAEQQQIQQQRADAEMAALRQVVDSNAKAIQAGTTELTEIRTILRQSVQQHDREMAALRQTTDSNARAIRALASTVEEDRGEREQIESELKVGESENNQRINVLIGESRENLREHRAFRERFDQVLAEIRQIWQRLAG